MNGCDKKACQGKLETAGGLSVYIVSSCFDADIRQYFSLWLSVVYRVSSDTSCGFIIQRSRQAQDHYASSWLIMSRLLWRRLIWNSFLPRFLRKLGFDGLAFRIRGINEDPAETDVWKS